jgi:hypothetical protein
LRDNPATVDVWAGSAKLRIPEVQGEELHMTAPFWIGRRYRLKGHIQSRVSASRKAGLRVDQKYRWIAVISYRIEME